MDYDELTLGAKGHYGKSYGKVIGICGRGVFDKCPDLLFDFNYLYVFLLAAI